MHLNILMNIEFHAFYRVSHHATIMWKLSFTSRMPQLILYIIIFD